jgi:peptidoglycan/xylan/chitin deacetylase (PgdA/CDA1 family)
MRTIKCLFYHLMGALGVFALSRRLTCKGLRILCFHGGSFADEHLFMPGVFMSSAVFRQRLDYLSRRRYPVLGLGEALDRLARDELPPCATVLTFDDGFASTFHDALGPLRQHGFPATVYVTTYHVAKGTPVFNLLVRYLLWKSKARELCCDGLSAGPTGVWPIRTSEEKGRLAEKIIEDARARLTEEQRSALSRELGRRLGVDHDALVARRCFDLMTAEEIRTLAAAGIDVQLHTHRHRFPVHEELARCEILDNRALLSGLVARPLEDFCYPSGIWSSEHWPWLSAVGVRSATTCDLGLNYPDTPRYALKRFLDFDDLRPIEFAAEMSGFAECIRRLRSFCRRILQSTGVIRHQASGIRQESGDNTQSAGPLLA